MRHQKFRALAVALNDVNGYQWTGVGLRQLNDYWMLLRKSSTEDRQLVASQLKAFGLTSMARALMWVIGELFLEHDSLLPIKPSARKGR